MRSRLISRVLLPASLLLSTFPLPAHAAVQDRIASAVNSNRVPLSGTVWGHAKHSVDLGQAPANQKLNSLSLRFNMTAAQQADLTQLLAAQLNPSSPQYHQWLTPEQFGARFGLSSSDLTKVTTWLTSQGFAVTGVARSSTFINFSGTVAQAQQAFGTTIHSVSYNGEQHITNLTDPMLPSAISGVVSNITGLSDFKAKPHSRHLTPAYTQTISTTTSHYIAPGDLYTIYNFPPSSSSDNGTGVKVAVVGQTDINTTNINAFQSAAGLPAKTTTTLQQVLVPGSADPGVSPPDVDEAHIDVEWSGASAPGATIVYVFSTDVFAGSLSYVIDNKVAPIVTVSYGLCETAFGSSSLNSYNQIFAQANAQGMTIISAAGDTGAADCDSAGAATEGLGADFPGSSPYVTSAGGTMFTGDSNTPATYWSSANGANAGSALLYIPEQPWNETSPTTGLSDSAGNGLGAGGGGASAFFAKPSWQQGTGAGATPSDGSRDVPDFSLNAAALHDGYVVCSSGSSNQDFPCTNGFATSSPNGQANIFGGTSFVAPIFAGILARVEQQIGNTTGLGNVGPTLYGLANGPTYSSVFHDITSGNNSVICIQGTLNCQNGGSIGYTAGTGYDQASGLGSLNVANLVNGWGTAVPTGTAGTTTTSGTGITTTSLTVATSNTSLCAISGNVALTVTVAAVTANGPAPTGTVQILVDNGMVGTVTLASGAASYSLNTSGLSSGGHTVSAVYLGDGNYSGSKGTLLAANASPLTYPNGPIASIDVVSSTKPDFSLNPCTGTQSVTVQPGATSTGITFALVPVNSFTGTINLSAVNNAGMAGTPTFSVSPVSITGSSSVTTTLTIKASQTTTALNTLPARPHNSDRAPWYAAGSGVTVACMLLLTVPRRRRWGALLAAVISVAALTAVGCSNTSTTGASGSGGSNPSGPTNTTTNAGPGLYTFTIVATTSTGLSHSSQVTVTVPCPDGTLSCLQQ